MKLPLVGFLYEKVRIFVLNKSRFIRGLLFDFVDNCHAMCFFYKGTLWFCKYTSLYIYFRIWSGKR